MKTIQVVPNSNGMSLAEREAVQPAPGQGEVLVRVRAAGVTPTELVWYPTTHKKDGGVRERAVPGHEFSGVVESVGPGVSLMEVGREVYGMNDWFCEGSTAECCTAPFDSIAPKPPNLTHAEAASVPIGALTAWQGLFDHAKLQPGERVLIQGGSGSGRAVCRATGQIPGCPCDRDGIGPESGVCGRAGGGRSVGLREGSL